MIHIPDQKKWEAFPKEVQMKNIAVEVMRVTESRLHPEASSDAMLHGALERALALVDASLVDSKWKDDHTYLWRLRNAIAALYAEKSHPAISYYIAHQLLEV